MQELQVYSEGDWIVHAHYGMGQIKDIEVKGISGEEKDYFRVETTNSTFWMPVEQEDSELVRPVSTFEEIQEAVAVLKNDPREMSSNYKTRQSRIQEAKARNTPKTIARLIRDLRARKRAKGMLNGNERSAFNSLKQRLTEEWAIVAGVKTKQVEATLNNLLKIPQVN